MENPWHGAGQGADDATPQWIVQADSMMHAYQSQATISTLSNPNLTNTISQGIDTFLDDTWMSNNGHCNQIQTIHHTAQTNLTLWHDILKASSGLLNLQKCVWFMFNWKHYPSGRTQLIAPPATNVLTITNHHNITQPIWLLQPKEAHQYLGVQLTTNGNHKQELLLYQACNKCYILLLTHCPLTHREARVVYLQYYLPTVSYPLPATTMPVNQLLQYQGGETAAFLSKMGYPRTFPQVATYASTHHGGLQKCLQIIKYLQSNTTIGKTYLNLIQQYQLLSGFPQLILETADTYPGAKNLGLTMYVPSFAASMEKSSYTRPGHHNQDANMTDPS